MKNSFSAVLVLVAFLFSGCALFDQLSHGPPAEPKTLVPIKGYLGIEFGQSEQQIRAKHPQSKIEVLSQHDKRLVVDKHSALGLEWRLTFNFINEKLTSIDLDLLDVRLANNVKFREILDTYNRNYGDVGYISRDQRAGKDRYITLAKWVDRENSALIEVSRLHDGAETYFGLSIKYISVGLQDAETSKNSEANKDSI